MINISQDNWCLGNCHDTSVLIFCSHIEIWWAQECHCRSVQQDISVLEWKVPCWSNYVYFSSPWRCTSSPAVKSENKKDTRKKMLSYVKKTFWTLSKRMQMLLERTCLFAIWVNVDIFLFFYYESPIFLTWIPAVVKDIFLTSLSRWMLRWYLKMHYHYSHISSSFPFHFGDVKCLIKILQFVKLYSNLGSKCCHWKQHNEAAVIKMTYLIEHLR
jgi:hypothetical protein